MKRILVLSILICTSVLAISQESYEALCKKGNEEINNKNYAKALSFFDAAFKVGCDDETERAWTASIAAICAKKTQDFNKALMYNNIAIKSNTTDISVYETQLEIAKQLKDNKTIEEVLLLGREKLEGQYERFTTKLLYFYYNNKMYDKVLTTADEVLKYKPDNVKTYYFKGVSYLATGNKSDAIKLFQYALSLDSMDINTNKQLGFIYYNQGSAIHDKAKTYYNSIKKPTREDYSNYRKKIEESIIPYKQAIPYLENSYKAEENAKIKEALFLLFTRLEQKENAAKYKTKNE